MKRKKIKFCKLFVLILLSSINSKGQLVNVQANTGNGTTNFIPLWTTGSPTFHLGDSQIQDNGTNVGIGLSPSYKLDVNGDVRIPSTSAYRIGGTLPFLWNNNLTKSLFLGYYTGYTGDDNTYVGYLAGTANPGYSNTFIGSNAGAGAGAYNNQNTGIGHNALLSLTRYGGTAVGFSAACSTSTGCGVTAMGEYALYINTTGGYNCAFGHRSGQTLVTGSNNIFIGNLADVGAGNTGISNAAAIGANAVVTNSNEMILGDNSVYVGIGYSGVATFPPGKLSVDKTEEVVSPTIAGYFHNGDYQSDPSSGLYKRGIHSICDGKFANHNGAFYLTNIGGEFEARNAEERNIAVLGKVNRINEEDVGLDGYGGWFEAKSFVNNNIGVYASSDGLGKYTNYGIYAEAPIGSCSNGSCSDAAGYFNGDVYTTSAAYFTSDANLKDNIQPIQNATSIVTALNPKKFTFRNNQFPYLNLPVGDQDGLLAQEVMNVLPHLVNSFKIPPRQDSLGNADTTGTNISFLAVNYVGLIPYLIGAIKEQQHTIDSLINRDSINNARMDQLEQLVNNCCANTPGGSGHKRNAIDVDLGSENTIILNQNDPNPFAEQTRITYSVPANVIEAKIIFFDNSGHVMQTVTINDRGDGQINVYGEKLSSGIYSYTLLADGKVIDTKKMICSK